MSKRVRLPSLTIVIPAYNEEKNLAFVLKDIIKDASSFLSDYEILIIDDGSIDKTGEIADQFSRKYKQIKVIHQENGGYGKAMLNGIKEAKKDFVAYMPADGQFLLRDMQFCLPYMKEADLILGARGSRADYSLYRLIISYAYLIVLRALFGVAFQDVNWLNIWNRKKVQKIKIDSQGVFILAEIVIRFQKKGLRVVEAPSFYRPRKSGRAKNAKLSIVIRTFFDAVSLWFKLSVLQKLR